MLVGSYTSIEHDYALVPADPWRNEAAILEQGAEKTEPFVTDWVFSHAQHRRLAKRKALRSRPTGAATVVADFGGLNIWGRRFIYLDVADSDWDAIQQVPVEIIGRPRFNPNALEVQFDCIAIDVDALDAWDAENDEGTAPTVPSSSDEPDIDTPTLTGITQDGNKLDLTLTDRPSGANIAIRWRELGSEDWFGPTIKEPVDVGGGVWQVTTNTVILGVTLEVSIAAVIDGVYSDWFAPPMEFTTTGGA